MKKCLTLIIIFNLISTIGHSQEPHDLCENAKSFYGSLFNHDSIYYGNFSNGFLWPVMGQLFEKTVDAKNEIPSFSSVNCEGYISETDPNFVDVWYKKEIEISSSISGPNLIFFTSDTAHVSMYFGTCGNLYQHKCYTLLPGSYLDSFYYFQPILNSGDSLYIQISFPEGELPVYFDLGFGENFSLLNPSYFGYVVKAIENNGTSSQNDLRNKEAEVTIFPNPTNDHFYLSTHDENSKVEIFSFNGKLIKEVEFVDGYFKINDISKGIYWVKLYNHEKVLFKKLVKI